MRRQDLPRQLRQRQYKINELSPPAPATLCLTTVHESTPEQLQPYLSDAVWSRLWESGRNITPCSPHSTVAQESNSCYPSTSLTATMPRLRNSPREPNPVNTTKVILFTIVIACLAAGGLYYMGRKFGTAHPTSCPPPSGARVPSGQSCLNENFGFVESQ